MVRRHWCGKKWVTVFSLSEPLERKSWVFNPREINVDWYNLFLRNWVCTSPEAFSNCLPYPQDQVGDILQALAAPILALLAICISVSPLNDECCEGGSVSCSLLHTWRPAQGAFQCSLWGPKHRVRTFKHQDRPCPTDGTGRYFSPSKAKEIAARILWSQDHLDMILTSRNQPTWLLGRLTSLGSSQPPQLAGLAFENGLCAHAPLRLACVVAWSCYIKVGTGAWVQQEHTSWRAGQPHIYLYLTPNNSQLMAEL